MIVDRNPGTLRRALARLRELITPGEVEDDDADASSLLGSSDDLAEILLEDELETRGMEPAASPGMTRPEPIAAGPEPPSPAIAPGVALSRFRTAKPAATPKAAPLTRAASAAAAAATTSPGTTSRGGTTLGRVRPKRVRADGGEGGPVVDPLLRLLADF
jgi:hypothetical protein